MLNSNFSLFIYFRSLFIINLLVIIIIIIMNFVLLFYFILIFYFLSSPFILPNLFITRIYICMYVYTFRSLPLIFLSVTLTQ